jgi:SAM-dependent methyltransferase
MGWYSTFFDDLYGTVLADQFTPALTAQHAQIVRRLLGLRRGQTVLDVPCGQGRIAIPLAKLGMDVTGVDFSQPYLRRARRAAREAGVRVRWVCRDMRDIAFHEEFDAAYNWFGSFGYFSDRDNLAFARRVLAALRPGGRFLVEGFNKTWLLRHHLSQWEETHGEVHVANVWRWDERTDRMRDVWTMTKGQRRVKRSVSVRQYTGAEIRDVLLGAGFERVELFRRLPTPVRFTANSRKWVAVAHKADGAEPRRTKVRA